jgi:PPOX class probable F420-dependent enzyme
VISTRQGAIKARNIRRNPRAAFCVLSERFFGAWHTLEGEADVVSLPDAMEPLVDYFRRVSGEHPDWQEYREAMARDHRVLLRITVDRSGPTTEG